LWGVSTSTVQVSSERESTAMGDGEGEAWKAEAWGWVKEAREERERIPGGPVASKSLAWAGRARGSGGDEPAIREAENHSPRTDSRIFPARIATLSYRGGSCDWRSLWRDGMRSKRETVVSSESMDSVRNWKVFHCSRMRSVRAAEGTREWMRSRRASSGRPRESWKREGRLCSVLRSPKGRHVARRGRGTWNASQMLAKVLREPDRDSESAPPY